MRLAVFGGEVFHEFGDVLDGIEAVGVVDGNTDAADAAMALEADKSGSQAVSDKFLFQFFAIEVKDHVHG